MQATQRPLLVFLAISSLALAATIGFRVFGDSHAQSATASTQVSQGDTRTLTHNYGSWDYQASVVSGQGVSVKINYDRQSIAGLRAFAVANQQLADQLAAKGGQATFTITFRNFVSLDQFRSWVKATGIQINDSMVAAYDMKGYGVSLSDGAQGSDPLPQSVIDRSIANMSTPEPHGAVTPPLTVRGVYETSGTVDAKMLPQLSKDPLVFVADVTANIVYSDLAAAGVPNPDQATIVVDPPFRKLLDFGLENFR